MNHARFTQRTVFFHASAPLIACLIIASLAFSSCSPAITLKVRSGATDTASFSAVLSPTAENIVRRITDTEGTKSDTAADTGTLYDREAILVSLAHAGFRADSLELSGRAGIKLALALVKTDGFLGNAVNLRKDERKIAITLSRDTLAKALDLMPPETRDYLDLFMAPALTGETMTIGEYEELIAATYGKTLATELKNSFFTLSVQCPAAATGAKITVPGSASKNGNTVTFRLPLSTLLILSKPVIAEANW